MPLSDETIQKQKERRATLLALNTELSKHYSELKNALGTPLCTFWDTTNPSFKDRIHLDGKLYSQGTVIQFIPQEIPHTGVMRTSYVVKVQYSELQNLLIVTTRNSEYKFLVTYTHELGSIKDTPWELPADLKEQYESFVEVYYGF